MKRRHFHRHIRLWLLMSGIFTLILTLTTSAIILIYQVGLKDRYEEGLRLELQNAESLLIQNQFSETAQSQVSATGIHLLLLEAETGRILTQDPAGMPLDLLLGRGSPSRQERRRQTSDDSALLLKLVEEHLEHGETGSFFLTDAQEGREQDQRNTMLALCGRWTDWVYSLYLPVESTNAAISLAIRYATLVSIGAWGICLLLFYALSKVVTRPHRKIAGIASQIAELDFSDRCPEALTWELNDMSHAINVMADSLEANVEALRGANEKLHRELCERTRQQQITADLIANLSHDLKTPIAIISGYAEGLREGVAQNPEKQQLYYDMILRESEHMQSIVSQMLALGRMESGQTPVRPEDFDLTVLLDQVLDSFQREIERLGLELTREGRRPCMVHTDYACARQSIINYIQNAVFHINNGKRIRVRLEDLGDRIRVGVTNSSSPIPPEEAARLWEKLYRGDPSRQRHKGEMGLGLSIVKGNMERLGHAYGVQNDPEFGGVCFWLELPKSDEGTTE